MPTDAEEIWRYSRIGDCTIDAFVPAVPATDPVDAGEVAGSLPAPVAQMLRAIGAPSAFAVTRNGSLGGIEVAPELVHDGVSVAGVASRSPGDNVLGSVARGATDLFVELNDGFLHDALVVDIPPKVRCAAPIVIVHWIDADGAAVFPRTVVRAGAGAEAVVVEVVASDDVTALVVPVVELDIADDARVGHLGIQHLGRQVWQLGYQASRIAAGAELLSFTGAFGGFYARQRIDSVLAGERGVSNLLAASFGDDDQMLDFRTFQRHDAARTTSDLLFKGALAGHARSVYSGLIRISPGARRSDALQTNRNLVLSEGAHADSVPNLDIQENDVRCSHASAVGPVDEDQRYYLESRGVPPAEAERLIVLGFFSEVLDRLPVPAVRDLAIGQVAAKFAGTSVEGQPGG